MVVCGKVGRSGERSRPKCPPLQLPIPQRDESGEILTLNFHIWSRNLEILVTKQGWKPDYVKLQLGTNAKILPKLWRDMMMNANVRRVSTDHIVTWGGRRNRRSEGSHRPPSV